MCVVGLILNLQKVLSKLSVLHDCGWGEEELLGSMGWGSAAHTGTGS